MPFLPSINVDDKVPHVLAKFNTGTGRPLVEYHEALLRGESPFTIAEREMMAAYVSGVNACQYCHGAPGMVATFADAPFSSPELEELLVKGGTFTWAAGPLVKGSNLCHGTGGNGYAFLKLYRRTDDPMWLERARAFAMTAIAQCREVREQTGRGRYTLWTGDVGLAIYLWDCLTADPRFPSIDVF